jgi:hypothetical protein
MLNFYDFKMNLKRVLQKKTLGVDSQEWGLDLSLVLKKALIKWIILLNIHYVIQYKFIQISILISKKTCSVLNNTTREWTTVIINIKSKKRGLTSSVWIIYRSTKQ